MRVTKERIRFVSAAVLEKLRSYQLFEVTGSKEKLVDMLEKAVMDELLIEDRLNAEVQMLLKQYDAEFNSGRADYQKMFAMVKNKLVEERGVIL